MNARMYKLRRTLLSPRHQPQCVELHFTIATRERAQLDTYLRCVMDCALQYLHEFSHVRGVRVCVHVRTSWPIVYWTFALI